MYLQLAARVLPCGNIILICPLRGLTALAFGISGMIVCYDQHFDLS